MIDHYTHDATTPDDATGDTAPLDDATGDTVPPDHTTPDDTTHGNTGRDGGHGLTRRRIVAAVGAAAVAGLAGCSTDDGPTTTPTPVSLAGAKQCEVCGMVISEHPGPGAAVFFADHTPESHDGPAWFDSVKEMYVYVWERERRGWEPTVTYVTDYSAVDYAITDEGDTPVISRHVAPASFAPAAEVTYVAGSDVIGAMGVDLLPFTERADAAAFRDEHGGWLVAHEEVTEETLQRLRTGERA